MSQGTNTVALRYAKESAWGTTPTTGWNELRYTGESLVPTQQTVDSGEILATREEQAPVRVAVGGQGDINFEMHAATFDDFLVGALGGTWSTDVLKVGTTLDSFSLEKAFTEIATPEYMLFPGAIVNTFAVDVAVRSIITGSVGFLTLQPSFDTEEASATPPTAVNTNPIFNGIDHVSAIEEGGSAFAGVQRISFNIDNGLRSQDQLGSLNPIGMAPSKFKLRGSITAYFASSAKVAKLLAFTETSLAFTLGVPAGGRYAFDISKMKYTDARVVAGGGDQDVLAELSWSAYVDATDSTLKITRTAP